VKLSSFERRRKLMGEDLREKVRERYAGVARAIQEGTESGGSCCGPASCGGSSTRTLEVDMTGGGYSEGEKRELPQLASDASLGCGNPVALAALLPGEVVLDLGSGGGIDVLLSARRVAPGGKAYGLDMTDEMLSLARENQEKAGVENVEFLKGEIEDVPLPEGHVDVVISNCVINLSTQKERVIGEAFRVLKPGGRFAVSDVVFLGEKGRIPAEVVRSVELWSGCISGALEKSEYEKLLSSAGFEDVSVEITHTYSPELMDGLGGPEDVEALRQVPVASAFVRARKPE
jgi:SAM-dependent methyltransferase